MSPEEKQQNWKQLAYDKLLKGEDLLVKEVSKLIGKSSITMRWWESQGITTKPRKTPDGRYRVYNAKELHKLLCDILNYDWERNCLDREELEKIRAYLEAYCIANDETNKRRVGDAYNYRGAY